MDRKAAIPELESPEEISEDQAEDEKTSEGSSSETGHVVEIAASEEKETRGEMEGESSAAPAANEWEDFDTVRTDGCFFEGKKMQHPACVTYCACCCRRNWRHWTAPCRRSRATSGS